MRHPMPQVVTMPTASQPSAPSWFTSSMLFLRRLVMCASVYSQRSIEITLLSLAFTFTFTSTRVTVKVALVTSFVYGRQRTFDRVRDADREAPCLWGEVWMAS